MVWLEITSEQQDNYDEMKKLMEKAIMPMNFVSLDEFHHRRLQPGEAISLYVHELRKLLTHALQDLEQAVREPFLLHQLLAGIPEDISK